MPKVDELIKITETAFQIKTRSGAKQVDGEIRGDYGVHKDKSWWVLTHVPSGFQAFRDNNKKRVTKLMAYINQEMKSRWDGQGKKPPQEFTQELGNLILAWKRDMPSPAKEPDRVKWVKKDKGW